VEWKNSRTQADYSGKVLAVRPAREGKYSMRYGSALAPSKSFWPAIRESLWSRRIHPALFALNLGDSDRAAGGIIGFRQMAPLMAEYANLVVERIAAK
jgi:hypothetical protein